VERLSTSLTYFYIHVDLTVDINPFKYKLKDKQNVTFLSLEKRVSSIWGSPALVQATLNAINEVIKDNRHGYTILISGQCYPIKPNEYIYSFFKENYGCNFIEGFELPDPRWPSSYVRMHHYAFFMSTKKEDFVTAPSIFDEPFKHLFEKNTIKRYIKIFLNYPLKSIVLIKKREFPKNLRPYGGMQWWALPLESLKFINRYVADNPSYLKYHKYTLFSDEIFFQTIIHNYFNEVGAPTTFASWPGEDSISSPETITARHFNMLQKRKELFARKFDYAIDTRVLDLIDSILLHTA
jgi:hypothetical protein